MILLIKYLISLDEICNANARRRQHRFDEFGRVSSIGEFESARKQSTLATPQLIYGFVQLHRNETIGMEQRDSYRHSGNILGLVTDPVLKYTSYVLGHFSRRRWKLLIFLSLSLKQPCHLFRNLKHQLASMHNEYYRWYTLVRAAVSWQRVDRRSNIDSDIIKRIKQILRTWERFLMVDMKQLELCGVIAFDGQYLRLHFRLV